MMTCIIKLTDFRIKYQTGANFDSLGKDFEHHYLHKFYAVLNYWVELKGSSSYNLFYWVSFFACEGNFLGIWYLWFTNRLLHAIWETMALLVTWL